MMVIACAVLAIAIVIYVFSEPGQIDSGPEKGRLAFLRERREMVFENLRDLNFEFKAGKLSAADFETVRSSLETEAGSIVSEISALEGSAG